MAAMMHGLLSGEPPVGLGGIFSMGDAGRLASLVTDAGFVDVKVDGFAITFRAADIDAHLERVIFLAPLACVLDEASAGPQAAVRRNRHGPRLLTSHCGRPRNPWTSTPGVRSTRSQPMNFK